MLNRYHKANRTYDHINFLEIAINPAIKAAGMHGNHQDSKSRVNSINLVLPIHGSGIILSGHLLPPVAPFTNMG